MERFTTAKLCPAGAQMLVLKLRPPPGRGHRPGADGRAGGPLPYMVGGSRAPPREGTRPGPPARTAATAKPWGAGVFLWSGRGHGRRGSLAGRTPLLRQRVEDGSARGWPGRPSGFPTQPKRQRHGRGRAAPRKKFVRRGERSLRRGDWFRRKPQHPTPLSTPTFPPPASSEHARPTGRACGLSGVFPAPRRRPSIQGKQRRAGFFHPSARPASFPSRPDGGPDHHRPPDQSRARRTPFHPPDDGLTPRTPSRRHGSTPATTAAVRSWTTPQFRRLRRQA